MGEKRGTKALELWSRRMVEDYGVRIDNMTHSWKDGIAFCALVSKCLSIKQISCDLIQFDKLKKEDIYENNDLAFRVAEEFLKIPSLLDPADMVAYDTPDKLSILTYLSQFYQVFGAQENSLRLSKRSSTEASKSSSSSSSSSPAKMAYVPKRDPCVKCNNPVFFAERLVIEDHLYHRTCFQCARCSSVLTLGNFYQTEKDNEFCCETCPDEERSNSSVSKSGETNRLSIAQRIALFERETSSVLKKSLSDEEKSKSLNRQLQSSTSQGLSSFLTTQLKQENEEEHKNDSSSSSEDSDGEEDVKEKPQELTDEKIASTSAADIDHPKENSPTEKSIIPSLNEPELKTPAVEIINESQNSIDRAMAEITSEDFGDSQNNIQDEFEIEFEKLAEEAVSSSFTPIIIKKQPIKQLEEPIVVVADTSKEIIKIKEIEEIPIKIEVNDETFEEVDVKEPEQIKDNDYPENNNPFDDDEEDEEIKTETIKRPSLNPFGSCSDEDDEIHKTKTENQPTKIYNTLPKPPRPPPPKTSEKFKAISTNPFDSDDDNEEMNGKDLSHTKTPIPTPRRLVPSSTPEPSIRTNFTNSPAQSFKGSTSSLASSTDGLGFRRKKKKAPLPPTISINSTNTLEVTSIDNEVHEKTPAATPKKKRPAPTPPSSTPFPIRNDATHYITANDNTIEHSDDISLSLSTENSLAIDITEESQSSTTDNESTRRLIPLVESLKEDSSSASTSSSGVKIEEEVTYRRKIMPLSDSVDNDCDNVESIKDNKEAENRQRQSQYSLNDSIPYLNKSSHGKWKRRKGPAPALPGFAQPQKRVLQMLPLQEIRHELEVIEVQQQGLEKQGVMLEKMIRERCEGVGDNRTTEELLQTLPLATSKNPKEVEELILQLFELVNEKNELFRRQAELMYLRRAHRLEEEQADVEFEIRTLMAQPECNKTDSDKAKEEALIARLVEIVQLRNEVVDCLEMDRQRARDEDMSIKQRMESHTAKLDQEYLNQTPTKLSKKEKKKLKEAKKLKNKKLNDADKDLDTSESIPAEKKKKKKKFLF